MPVAWSINSAIWANSLTSKPRLVIGTEPILKPDGTNADLSFGTVFLFAYIPINSNRASILAPSIYLDFIFTSIKWLSVPPETRV